jgi:hypothetical protein
MNLANFRSKSQFLAVFLDKVPAIERIVAEENLSMGATESFMRMSYMMLNA